MPVPSSLQVTRAYLLSIDAVKAAGARVLTGTPSDRKAPWIRMFLVGDPPVGGGVPDHLIEAHLQLDVVAGEGTNSALVVDLLSLAVRDALSRMHEAEHEGAVVTGTECFRSGPFEGEGEPAVEYFRIAVTAWMHAA